MLNPDDSPEQIAKDVQAVSRIDAVPTLLRVLCETTGMGFAAVARVTAGSWTACAVQDDIQFGLLPGGQLDIHTTLCKEVRESRTPVVIEQASVDAAYHQHHTPRHYGIESYISVPIILKGDDYFGNLCAIDPRPAKLLEPRILATFKLFAELIALQLENERRHELERAALLDARAAGELGEQFIAILGHDLRNPLAAVTACAYMLERKGGDAEMQGIVQRIGTSVRRMSQLIDDVLDFARGRLGGGIGADLAEVHDIDQAFIDVVDELQASHPGRTVQSRIDVHRAMRCDRGRLQQVASNLLANALTHGSSDQPVAFSAIVEAGHLVITVSNDGDPIPPESVSQVFAPFWRRSTSAAREGLGLGLFICAQIVKAHHGSLDVASSTTHGTTFTAKIPLGTAAPNA